MPTKEEIQKRYQEILAEKAGSPSVPSTTAPSKEQIQARYQEILAQRQQAPTPTEALTPMVAPVEDRNIVQKGLDAGSSLFSGSSKFVGGGLLNVTNLIASKTKDVKNMTASDIALREIDTKAVTKAHELAVQGDTEGAKRLLGIVQSHGTNITLNDILPNSQQNTAKEISGAGLQTALEVGPFTKGLGMLAVSKATSPLFSSAPKVIQPIKSAIPKTFGAVKGAAGASGYASLFGASAGLQEEKPTTSSVIGSAYEYATNPLVLALGAGLGTLGGRFSPEAAKLKVKKIQRAVDDLENTYYKLASTKPLKKKLEKSIITTAQKDLAGTTGTNPIRTLAEEGIVPSQSGSKLNTTSQANELRNKLRSLQDVNKLVLEELDTQASRVGGIEKVSLSDLENQSISRAKTSQNINSGKFTGIEKELKKEFEDLRSIYGDEISYSTLGDIKSARWNGVKFDSTRPLIGDANYIIAKEAQQKIQDTAKSVGNEEVAQLNRYIGDRLEAAKFLESLDGNTVKGGRLQKYVFQAIGSTLSSNLLGKILGAFGGDAVANLLLSNQVSPILKRRILSKIQAQSPEVYKNTIQWLTKNKINPEFPTALPIGKTKIPETGSITTPYTKPTQFEPASKVISGKGQTPLSSLLYPDKTKLLPEGTGLTGKTIITPAPTLFEPRATKVGTMTTKKIEEISKEISEKYNIKKSLTSKIVESLMKELKK